MFSYSCSIAADYNSTKSDIKKYGPYDKVLLIGNEVTRGLRFQCFNNLCKYLCNPDWFTADAIAAVPPDMLPVSVLDAMGGVKGRRESIEAMKKEKEEKLKGESKRKQSVRGADLKIIPVEVGTDED